MTKVQWRNFLKCCFQEVEWYINKSTPTWDEYLKNRFITIGVELYSISFYFLGVEFSNLVKSDDYIALFNHAGIHGGLSNDFGGKDEDGRVQREMNGCLLLLSYGDRGVTSIEEAKEEVKRIVESSRREELRTMLDNYETVDIPKEIIESFFKLTKICYYLYHGKTDEYRSPETASDDINELFYHPLNLLSNTNQPSK